MNDYIGEPTCGWRIANAAVSLLLFRIILTQVLGAHIKNYI
jgi:hypothetical protein